MKLAHAQIFAELLTNAGYVDDADELFADRLQEQTPEEVLQFASDMDDMIAEANSVLPDDEKIELKRSMVEEVQSQL